MRFNATCRLIHVELYQVHWAVRKGRVEMLRKLISRGWFVDECGFNKDTPLLVASEDESDATLECINMLCIAGVRTEYEIRKRDMLHHLRDPWVSGTGAAAECLPCCALWRAIMSRQRRLCWSVGRRPHPYIQILECLLSMYVPLSISNTFCLNAATSDCHQ